MVLAVLVLVCALEVTISANQQRGSGFTQLWAVPMSDPSQSSLKVGIQSMERSTVKFRLELQENNRVVSEWPWIQLAPGRNGKQQVGSN